MAGASDGDSQNQFVLAAFAEISFGLLAIVLGWIFGPDPHEGIPSLSDSLRLVEGIVLGACLGAVLAAGVFALARLPFRGLRELQEMMESRLRDFLIRLTPVELVVLSLAAGFGEEFLFRGWLQQGLFSLLGADKSMVWGTVGLLIASILFGLAHPISPLYVLLASIMGLVFGVLYWMTGNLLTAIVAHAVYDAVILLKWNRDTRNASLLRNDG
jgi:membrane protease YdiL (CAAX protease family)